MDNIDFIKGIAAISVILLHTLPRKVLYASFAVYHIWQAVPIFIFISFYLGFRNLEKKEHIIRKYYSKNRVKKIFLKLWLPLIILAVIEASFFIFIGRREMVMGCLLCYANGPGSYYIWCYMQIWILIPVIYFLLKSMGLHVGGGILLVFSISLDFFWERYVDIRPSYTCFRYLFLSVPAYMCLKNISIKRSMPFILLSIIYLALMVYSKVPVFADSFLPDGWESQTSFSFFYTFLLFAWLSKLYEKLNATRIKEYITHLGTISWEIFLVQMVILGSGVINYASSSIFDSNYIQVGFKVIVVLLFTLLLAELYKKVGRQDKK